jgi:hypothetical protein
LIFTWFEEEAEMTKPVSRRRPFSIFTVASIALAILLSDVAQSSAACGGYCEARQVRAICHDAVASRGLKAQKRDAEFEKCASDPLSYRIQPVQAGGQFGLD